MHKTLEEYLEKRVWILKRILDDSNATEVYDVFKTREEAYNYMVNKYFDGEFSEMDGFLVEDMTDCWDDDGWIYEITYGTIHF